MTVAFGGTEPDGLLTSFGCSAYTGRPVSRSSPIGFGPEDVDSITLAAVDGDTGGAHSSRATVATTRCSTRRGTEGARLEAAENSPEAACRIMAEASAESTSGPTTALRSTTTSAAAVDTVRALGSAGVTVPGSVADVTVASLGARLSLLCGNSTIRALGSEEAVAGAITEATLVPLCVMTVGTLGADNCCTSTADSRALGRGVAVTTAETAAELFCCATAL